MESVTRPGFLRQLPNNKDLEQSILGAIFINQAVWDDLADTVRGEHFFFKQHQVLWDEIFRMKENGGKADPVTLRVFSENNADLSEHGQKYLMELASAAVSKGNAVEYGRMLIDLAARRRLAMITADYQERAFTGEGETDIILKELQDELDGLGSSDSGNLPPPLPVSAAGALEGIEEAKAHPGSIRGSRSGFTGLDDKLGGMRGGQLIVLAGRPSMGKSALLVCIADNMLSGPGGPVIIFTLEMTTYEIILRLIAVRSKIPYWRLRDGKIDDVELACVRVIVEALSLERLYVDDRPALSMGEIKRRAERICKQRPAQLIAVDHIGLVRPDNHMANRVHQLEQITGDLKALAKSSGSTVIACSQLNRGVEMRDDKRPVISDLRDSGSIEQDADVILLLSRQERYLQTDQPRQRADEPDLKYADREVDWHLSLEKCKGKADLDVAKNRDGDCGLVILSFKGETMEFGNG